MITRTFECKGFDGKPFNVSFDFHLFPADVASINLGTFVGIDVLMKRLFDTKNGKEIVSILDTVIMKSVGQESANHQRFIRNKDIQDEFVETGAYSQLFMELTNDMEKLSDFFIGVLPSDMQEKILEKRAEEQANQDAAAPVLAAAT